MIKYSLKLGMINGTESLITSKNGKYFGKIEIPSFTSFFYKNVFIKTAFVFVLSSFKGVSTVDISSKIDIKPTDIEYGLKVLKLLNIVPPTDIKIERKELFKEPELRYLGSLKKDKSKHVIFFSGGKESWYNLLTLLETVPQENILLVYIRKINKTSKREMLTLDAVKLKYPKINYLIPAVTVTINKNYAYSLEYMLMLSVALDKILLFNGGTNITFGFQQWSYLDLDTYPDSFSETIEAEKLYLEYLKINFDIDLDPFNRLPIPEYFLYDYSFFEEKGVVPLVMSCIIPDGLAHLHRNQFRRDCPSIGTLVNDMMCGYCSKCSLRLFYEILRQDDAFFEKYTKEIKLWVCSFINREILPILPKIANPIQFFNYDVHFITFCMEQASQIAYRLKGLNKVENVIPDAFIKKSASHVRKTLREKARYVYNNHKGMFSGRNTLFSEK